MDHQTAILKFPILYQFLGERLKVPLLSYFFSYSSVYLFIKIRDVMSLYDVLFTKVVLYLAHLQPFKGYLQATYR